MQNENDSIKSYITLPLDQFGHQGAPSEWWWHIGTLEAKDGRKFGFEINGACVNGLYLTQIEITDVDRKVYYSKLHVFLLKPEGWAQYDPTKPWHVKMVPLLTPFDGSVMMQEVGGNPLNMLVQAAFVDAATGLQCQLILNFNQENNPPLLVWGTGRTPDILNPKGKTPLEQYNFYYSLTNLRASGYVIIGPEVIEVTGLTWMDHQYGFFGNPGHESGGVHWMLQDMQLSNGMHISNAYVMQPGEVIKENERYISYATVLLPSGESKLVTTYTTPMAPTYIDINKDKDEEVTYYLTFKVEVNEPGLGLAGTFIIKSLLADQVFSAANNYEGIGTCEANLDGVQQPVKGTAWIEQAYAATKTGRF